MHQVFENTPLASHLPTFNFSSRYIESINMTVSKLTEKMKRYTMLMILAVNHSNTEIINFLKVASSFVFSFKNELQASHWEESSMAKKKIYSKQSDEQLSSYISSKASSAMIPASEWELLLSISIYIDMYTSGTS